MVMMVMMIPTTTYAISHHLNIGVSAQSTSRYASVMSAECPSLSEFIKERERADRMNRWSYSPTCGRLTADNGG
jgi:hypothetical protein